MKKEPTETSQQRYRQRLDRVVAYIHANLETQIRADDLAEVACISSYHWHRIYSAMVGETITDTLRRLRLQRSADRLANSDMAISEIAELAQYGSADAFTRAFRRAYDLAPSQYRSSGSHANFKEAIASGNAGRFEVQIEEHDEIGYICVPHTGSYLRINAAMDKLFGILRKDGLLSPSTTMHAVFYDDATLIDEKLLRSAACTPWSPQLQIPTGTQEVVRPKGTYARLAYKGPYANMKSAYQWFYGVWLPESGFEMANQHCFETYLNSPVDTEQEELRTDLILPLEGNQ